ncbi:unnamed protein product [Amoebophrya sp. A120]|nr:unnamed protein product [Amoebophrya sp. A120]|eukprot:GSA120T00011230001.1
MPVFYAIKPMAGPQQVRQTVSAPARHVAYYNSTPEVQNRAHVPGQAGQEHQGTRTDPEPTGAPRVFKKGKGSLVPPHRGWKKMLGKLGRGEKKPHDLLAHPEPHLFASSTRGAGTSRDERHHITSPTFSPEKEHEHDFCDTAGASDRVLAPEKITFTRKSAIPFVDVVFDAFFLQEEEHERRRHNHNKLQENPHPRRTDGGGRRRPMGEVQQHQLQFLQSWLFFMLAVVLFDVLSPTSFLLVPHTACFAVKVVEDGANTADENNLMNSDFSSPGTTSTRESSSPLAAADSSTTATVSSAHQHLLRMTSSEQSGSHSDISTSGTRTPRPRKMKRANLRGAVARQRVLAANQGVLLELDDGSSASGETYVQDTSRPPHSWLAAFSAFLETLRASYHFRQTNNEVVGKEDEDLQRGVIEPPLPGGTSNDGELLKRPPTSDSHHPEDHGRIMKTEGGEDGPHDSTGDAFLQQDERHGDDHLSSSTLVSQDEKQKSGAPSHLQADAPASGGTSSPERNGISALQSSIAGLVPDSASSEAPASGTTTGGKMNDKVKEAAAIQHDVDPGPGHTASSLEGTEEEPEVRGRGLQAGGPYSSWNLAPVAVPARPLPPFHLPAGQRDPVSFLSETSSGGLPVPRGVSLSHHLSTTFQDVGSAVQNFGSQALAALPPSLFDSDALKNLAADAVQNTLRRPLEYLQSEVFEPAVAWIGDLIAKHMVPAKEKSEKLQQFFALVQQQVFSYISELMGVAAETATQLIPGLNIPVTLLFDTLLHRCLGEQFAEMLYREFNKISKAIFASVIQQALPEIWDSVVKALREKIEEKVNQLWEDGASLVTTGARNLGGFVEDSLEDFRDLFGKTEEQFDQLTTQKVTDVANEHLSQFKDLGDSANLVLAPVRVDTGGGPPQVTGVELYNEDPNDETENRPTAHLVLRRQGATFFHHARDSHTYPDEDHHHSVSDSDGESEHGDGGTATRPNKPGFRRMKSMMFPEDKLPLNWKVVKDPRAFFLAAKQRAAAAANAARAAARRTASAGQGAVNAVGHAAHATAEAMEGTFDVILDGMDSIKGYVGELGEQALEATTEMVALAKQFGENVRVVIRSGTNVLRDLKSTLLRTFKNSMRMIRRKIAQGTAKVFSMLYYHATLFLIVQIVGDLVFALFNVSEATGPAVALMLPAILDSALVAIGENKKIRKLVEDQIEQVFRVMIPSVVENVVTGLHEHVFAHNWLQHFFHNLMRSLPKLSFIAGGGNVLTKVTTKIESVVAKSTAGEDLDEENDFKFDDEESTTEQAGDGDGESDVEEHKTATEEGEDKKNYNFVSLVESLQGTVDEANGANQDEPADLDGGGGGANQDHEPADLDVGGGGGSGDAGSSTSTSSSALEKKPTTSSAVATPVSRASSSGRQSSIAARDNVELQLAGPLQARDPQPSHAASGSSSSSATPGAPSSGAVVSSSFLGNPGGQHNMADPSKTHVLDWSWNSQRDESERLALSTSMTRPVVFAGMSLTQLGAGEASSSGGFATKTFAMLGKLVKTAAVGLVSMIGKSPGIVQNLFAGIAAKKIASMAHDIVSNVGSMVGGFMLSFVSAAVALVVDNVPGLGTALGLMLPEIRLFLQGTLMSPDGGFDLLCLVDTLFSNGGEEDVEEQEGKAEADTPPRAETPSTDETDESEPQARRCKAKGGLQMVLHRAILEFFNPKPNPPPVDEDVAAASPREAGADPAVNEEAAIGNGRGRAITMMGILGGKAGKDDGGSSVFEDYFSKEAESKEGDSPSESDEQEPPERHQGALSPKRELAEAAARYDKHQQDEKDREARELEERKKKLREANGALVPRGEISRSSSGSSTDLALRDEENTLALISEDDERMRRAANGISRKPPPANSCAGPSSDDSASSTATPPTSSGGSDSASTSFVQQSTHVQSEWYNQGGQAREVAWSRPPEYKRARLKQILSVLLDEVSECFAKLRTFVAEALNTSWTSFEDIMDTKFFPWLNERLASPSSLAHLEESTFVKNMFEFLSSKKDSSAMHLPFRYVIALFYDLMEKVAGKSGNKGNGEASEEQSPTFLQRIENGLESAKAKAVDYLQAAATDLKNILLSIFSQGLHAALLVTMSHGISRLLNAALLMIPGVRQSPIPAFLAGLLPGLVFGFFKQEKVEQLTLNAVFGVVANSIRITKDVSGVIGKWVGEKFHTFAKLVGDRIRGHFFNDKDSDSMDNIQAAGAVVTAGTTASGAAGLYEKLTRSSVAQAPNENETPPDIKYVQYYSESTKTYIPARIIRADAQKVFSAETSAGICRPPCGSGDMASIPRGPPESDAIYVILFRYPQPAELENVAVTRFNDEEGQRPKEKVTRDQIAGHLTTTGQELQPLQLPQQQMFVTSIEVPGTTEKRESLVAPVTVIGEPAKIRQYRAGQTGYVRRDLLLNAISIGDIGRAQFLHEFDFRFKRQLNKNPYRWEFTRLSDEEIAALPLQERNLGLWAPFMVFQVDLEESWLFIDPFINPVQEQHSAIMSSSSLWTFFAQLRDRFVIVMNWLLSIYRFVVGRQNEKFEFLIEMLPGSEKSYLALKINDGFDSRHVMFDETETPRHGKEADHLN